MDDESGHADMDIAILKALLKGFYDTTINIILFLLIFSTIFACLAREKWPLMNSMSFWINLLRKYSFDRNIMHEN